MMFWIALWKGVLIFTVGIYAIMAVWVTIQGAFDIRSMLSDLRERHEGEPDA